MAGAFIPKEVRDTLDGFQKQLQDFVDEVKAYRDATSAYTEGMNNLEIRLKSLEVSLEEVKNTQASAPPTQQNVPVVEHQADDDTVKVVTDILGPQFQVIKTAHSSDSFLLTIIPPEHLKESPEDKRVKVIRTYEGLNGVREFTDKVKAFCVDFAQKKGVPYTL